MTNYFQKNLISFKLKLIFLTFRISNMPRKDSSQSNRSKKRDSKFKKGGKSIYSAKHTRMIANRGVGKNNKSKNKKAKSN